MFEPIYESQFDSDLERDFARYLDEQRALQWWHRIASRQQGTFRLVFDEAEFPGALAGLDA